MSDGGIDPIRVAVIDDSAFMRIALRQMLSRLKGVEVVAEGRSGAEAIEIAATLAPDLMTLDVLMPGMSGIEALETIMERSPLPVIMVSTETVDGALTTMRALDLGAVDVIAKGTALARLDMAAIESRLAEKVIYWGRPDRRPVRRARPVAASLLRRPVVPQEPPEVLVLATSTGGPRAVTALVGALRPSRCPIVVVQHMPAGFTADFARHLALRTGRRVLEAAPGQVLEPGLVAILPGGVNSALARGETGRLVVTATGDDAGAVRPSADIVMRAAAETARLAVAAILTGMGDDGTAGARLFAERGWPVLVQDPATCVVGGMPQAAIAAGAVSEVLTLAAMARRLNDWLAPRQEREGEAS